MMRTGLVLLATLLALGAAPRGAQSKQDVPLCRGGLRFLKSIGEGVDSVQTTYGLRLRNTGRRACVAPHFLAVEVQARTRAPIDVEPQLHLEGDPATVASLGPALVVQPGQIVQATVFVTTPCGHRMTNVMGTIVFVADEWPVYRTTSITTDLCLDPSNAVDLFPLRHV